MGEWLILPRTKQVIGKLCVHLKKKNQTGKMKKPWGPSSLENSRELYLSGCFLYLFLSVVCRLWPFQAFVCGRKDLMLNFWDFQPGWFKTEQQSSQLNILQKGYVQKQGNVGDAERHCSDFNSEFIFLHKLLDLVVGLFCNQNVKNVCGYWHELRKLVFLRMDKEAVNGKIARRWM